MAQASLPPWIQALQQRDPEFVESYMGQRERILKDGAIPAKYKILMTMVVDAIQSHPDGVATIANRARAAGASESEIQETVEVAYLFGGTPALVTAMNAFRTS
jgi:alkylhydroperoxidase/carboxymuconolactone decarboxylase family protein YurZ